MYACVITYTGQKIVYALEPSSCSPGRNLRTPNYRRLKKKYYIWAKLRKHFCVLGHTHPDSNEES